MQVAALPTPVHRAANSCTPDLSPLAANRLTLVEQWEAMRGEGVTAAKVADILRVSRVNLYRGAPASVVWLSPMEFAEQRLGRPPKPPRCLM